MNLTRTKKEAGRKKEKRRELKLKSHIQARARLAEKTGTSKQDTHGVDIGPPIVRGRGIKGETRKDGKEGGSNRALAPSKAIDQTRGQEYQTNVKIGCLLGRKRGGGIRPGESDPTTLGFYRLLESAKLGQKFPAITPDTGKPTGLLMDHSASSTGTEHCEGEEDTPHTLVIYVLQHEK